MVKCSFALLIVHRYFLSCKKEVVGISYIFASVFGLFKLEFTYL